MTRANHFPANRRISFLAVIMLGLTAFAAAPPPGGGTSGGKARATQTAGRKVYQAKCAVCHKADGSGHSYLGPKANLRSPAVQRQSDAQLVAVIKSGNPPMPAWDGVLTTQQIHSVVRFIRTFNTLAKK